MKLSKSMINEIIKAVADREWSKRASGVRSFRLTQETKEFLIKGKLLEADGRTYTRNITGSP